MVLNLFDDSDNETDQNKDKIVINEEFARRYEHNKKREDLQRFEELKKSGAISETDSDSESESESESEEEELKKTDVKLFEALIKVRNQDPMLKQKDVKLFSSDEDDDDGNRKEKKKKKKKAVYLKDVVAKQLIDNGPDFINEDDGIAEKKGKSYNEEQEELKREFLKVVEEGDRHGDGDGDGEGDEDFFKVKGGEGEGEKEEGEEGGAEFREKVEEYFEGEDEESRFLKEFFLNKLWVDKKRKAEAGGEFANDDLDELLRDEEEIEKQEEYETNYRYEENAGDRVLGHSRKVEDSVRNKKNARKEQRKNKEERMKIAEMERKEELKRLKNLKKREMKEKIRRIREIAGIGEDESLALDADYLEEDFDPEEYDRIMRAAYDERYYNTEDNDPTFARNDDEDEGNIEKPDFEKEDELLGLTKGWDVSKSDVGFSALRERILKDGTDEESDDDSGREELGEEEEEKEATEQGNYEGASEEGKRKRKRKLSLLQRAKEAMMEEYYKLDYEDTIGDLKTRLNYVKVDPNRYGLKTEEILMLDDKELNQYVPMKKIAPYREKEYKVPDSKRYQQKMKIRELRQGKKSDDNKKRKKKRSRDDASTSISAAVDMGNDKVDKEETNDDVEKLSRKAKRKRRQAELKSSETRLMAYGKISTKSNSKKKH